MHARWGGVEFVVALPGAAHEKARATTSRVLEQFSKARFGAEDPFGATFTAGVATLSKDCDSLTELIRLAEQRRFLGKSAGRACVMGDGD